MQYLDRNQILQAVDIRFDEVACPEWGGNVRVRGVTAQEMNDYRESLVGTRVEPAADASKADRIVTFADYRNAKARLVVKGVVDAEGKRVFSDEDAADLGKKNPAVVDRLYVRIQELSGGGVKADEVALKNSDSGPSDVSRST